jgi:hypothetical protein
MKETRVRIMISLCLRRLPHHIRHDGYLGHKNLSIDKAKASFNDRGRDHPKPCNKGDGCDERMHDLQYSWRVSTYARHRGANRNPTSHRARLVSYPIKSIDADTGRKYEYGTVHGLVVET